MTGATGPFTSATARLSDAEIRAAISSGGGPFALSKADGVLEEVRIWGGHVRADYILNSNDSIGVVEIKSDRDTLRRFGEQVRVYSSFADRVILVVGWTHAARALGLAPVWWEVWIAERRAEGQTSLILIRDGGKNPDARPESIVRLLPVAEARRALAAAGVATSGTRMSAAQVRGQLVKLLPVADLRRLANDWFTRLSSQRNMSK